MTTFVVLAAGRGSRLGRVGDQLHKALIPLAGKAIISRQFELAPPHSKIVVITGYLADQVEEYVRFAHPNLDVTFVRETNWGKGPGASLLCARPEVGSNGYDDDLVFTACDTLWAPQTRMWKYDESWVATAPIPPGTPPTRWCRVVPTHNGLGEYVDRIDDKTPVVAPGSLCWTALGQVVEDDLDVFWGGLDVANPQAGEIQLSSGLNGVIDAGRPLRLQRIDWLDVGDEQAYRTAQAQFGTYDPVKPGQATYVMPETNRVVKFHADAQKLTGRIIRGRQLEHVTPRLLTYGMDMAVFEYVAGSSAYTVADQLGSTLVTSKLLDWWRDEFWERRFENRPSSWTETATNFYHARTYQRVAALHPVLRQQALDAVSRVDWDELIEETTPGPFHGDLTHANVLVPGMAADEPHWSFCALDWREDFGGQYDWGDLRYDLAKLLGGTRFNWEQARLGNFRYWEEGVEHERVINEFVEYSCDLDPYWVNVIAALTLICSAPLHAAPMDEILVARGTHWLSQVIA